MGDMIQLFRAERAIDAILPEHTHKGIATGARFWTTPVGSFRIEAAGEHPNKRFVFHNEAAGFQVQVPLTEVGLHALIMAMILAGAIDANGITAIKLIDAVQHIGSRQRDQWPYAGWLV